MHNDARHFSGSDGQSTRPAVFVSRVVHANMAPRHKPGHYVLFEKDRPAQLGDDIFVLFVEGGSCIWRLDGISDRELTVHSYNPERTETVPRQRISEFHPVMWSVKGIESVELGTYL